MRETILATGLQDVVDLETDYLPFDEARRRLTGCDVIVLPYPKSGEAASGALHMALSAGPCVAVTPIALFEEAGRAVYRLPGTDAETIARGLALLLSDQKVRTATALAASEWMDLRRWASVGTRSAGMLRGLSYKSAVTISTK